MEPPKVFLHNEIINCNLHQIGADDGYGSKKKGKENRGIEQRLVRKSQ